MITILLDDTGISPRVQTALAQADALVDRGHEVRIVTTADAPVSWRPSRARWEFVDTLPPAADGTVLGTAFPWNRFLTVDDEMFRTRIPRESEPLRVLLAGASQSEAGGIHEGYGAIAHARWFHQKLDLIRVSPWAPERDEPLDNVQEFHVALSTPEMTRLMHSCDVLVAPSHRDEHFGLAAAEGLAAGVAVAMTSIPVYRAFGEKQDFALFAPEDNAVELGEKLIELLSDPDLRQRLRRRGREIAERWRAPRVAEHLEKFLHDRPAHTV